MVDDIIFYSSEFYLNIPALESGAIARIEIATEYFLVRLALPERISVG